MGFTEAEIDNIFSYHAPKPGQLEKYENIRAAARDFAKVLVANTSAGADQTSAIDELRVCVMTANASIALEE